MNQILTTFKFLDPTTDTSNWKTYKDSQLNIEFKYPNNLTYKDLGNGVIKFIDNQNITKFNFSGFQSFTPVEFQNYLKQEHPMEILLTKKPLQIHKTGLGKQTWD